MKIADIFSRPVQDANRSNTERVDQTRQNPYAEQQKLRSGDDQVSLSSISRQLSRVSQILQDDEVARADKVADLKSRVQAGSYSEDVSSEDIARAIVSFANE